MWKERLVCTMDGKSFEIELTMGVLRVYFPSLTKWTETAPDWAKNQWERVRNDLNEWCRKTKIPLEIEDHAWVEFD